MVFIVIFLPSAACVLDDNGQWKYPVVYNHEPENNYLSSIIKRKILLLINGDGNIHI